MSFKPEAIVVDQAVVNRLTELWTSQMGQPPDEQQLASIVEDWVEEELYFREALRLGLDQKDTIIRRRLVQKLTFLTEDVMVSEPSDGTLRSYFDDNRRSYTEPATVSFSQVFVNGDASGASIDAVAEQLDEGVDYLTLGDPSLLSRDFTDHSPNQVSANFGGDFFDELARLETGGGWRGPIRSVYGYHFVRVHVFHPENDADYHDVKDAVIADFVRDARDEVKREHLAALKQRYDIVHSYSGREE